MRDDEPTPPPLSARELARSSRLSFLVRQLDRLDRIAEAAEEALKFEAATKAREAQAGVHREIQQIRIDLRGKRRRRESLERLQEEIDRARKKSKGRGADTYGDEPSPVISARVDEMCRLIELGMPRSSAARAVGIRPARLARFEREADAQEERGEWGMERSFVDALCAAECRVEERACAAVTDLLDPEYEPDSGRRLSAAKLFLTHRRRSDWSPRSETTGADGGPVAIQDVPPVPKLPPELLEEMDGAELASAIEARGRSARRRRLAIARGAVGEVPNTDDGGDNDDLEEE